MKPIAIEVAPLWGFFRYGNNIRRIGTILNAHFTEERVDYIANFSKLSSGLFDVWTIILDGLVPSYLLTSLEKEQITLQMFPNYRLIIFSN
ncbi:MAG: hypothetical protein ACI9P5_004148, partial [Saprospiraceae bacterium]